MASRFVYLSIRKTFLIACLLLCEPLFYTRANCTEVEGSIEIREVLQKIPKEHRKILEDFFKVLVVKHAFGYTLFGEKPVTFENIPTLQDLTSIKLWSPLIQGWKTWQKYQNLFPSPYFAFKEGKKCVYGLNYQAIILINLKKGNEVAKKLMVEQSDISNYLCKLIEKYPLSPNEHEKLGIFLGFGEENSKRFARAMALFNLLIELPHFPENIPEKFNELGSEEIKQIFYQKKRDRPTISVHHQDWNSVIQKYTSLTEEWLSLDQIYPQGPMTLIQLPMFIANKNLDETKKLYEHYACTRYKLMTILNSDNFLELIMHRYVNGE